MSCPSTAPLPTLQTRMANERALGISFIYAAQTWRQLAGIFGEYQDRALFGLTNVLVLFGGSKDGAFNQEISDMVGQVLVARRTWQTGARAGRTFPVKILRSCALRRSANSRNAGRLFSPRAANPSSPASRAASTANPAGDSWPASTSCVRG